VEVLALLANAKLGTTLGHMVRHAREDVHLPVVQRPRQKQRRLPHDQIARVVARYQDGQSINALAQEFGINRKTVMGHLQRSGIERRQNPRKMTDAEVNAAAARYAAGASLAVVATEFGIGDRTLRREFTAAGIPTRPRR